MEVGSWRIVARLLTLDFHATWLVNGAAHTFGEGWHNSHHAFPQSPRHGLLARELAICGLQHLGLDVKKTALRCRERLQVCSPGR